MTLPDREGVMVNDKLYVPQAVRTILHDRPTTA